MLASLAALEGFTVPQDIHHVESPEIELDLGDCLQGFLGQLVISSAFSL